MTTSHTKGKISAFIGSTTISLDIGERPLGNRPCIIHWPGFDGNDLSLSRNKANARRLVACWNYCINMTTAELESAAASQKKEPNAH